jgi:hypothetical protein
MLLIAGREGGSPAKGPVAGSPIQTHTRRERSPTGFVLALGIGLLFAAVVLPLAFNVSIAVVTLFATPTFAIGVALCVTSLPLGAWRGGGILVRVCAAAASFATVFIANPGPHIHAVAQAMWGLSDGWVESSDQRGHIQSASHYTRFHYTRFHSQHDASANSKP